MPFRSIRTLDGPLWIAGPREAMPLTALRRNRGLSLIPNGKVARSRAGSTAFGLANGVTPLARFTNVILGRTGTAIINIATDAILLDGTVGNGPLTGHQGHAIAPSVADNAATAGDFFYISDTSAMYKLDNALAVSQWGIDAVNPPTGAVVVSVPPIVIDAMDATGGWVPDDVTAFMTSNTIQIDGTSVMGHVAADTAGAITRTGLALDLETDFTINLIPPIAVPAVDEDWISFAVRFNKPRRVDSLQLVFGCDDDFNRGFSFDILLEDRVGKRGRQSQRKRGVADIPSIKNDEAEFKATTPGVALTIDVNDLLGDSVASSKDDTWARIRIPKLAFTENGDDPDWSAISAIKFVIRTNRKGAVTFYLDDLKLQGGVGMQGTYKYAQTHKNSVTGHRGNAVTLVPTVVEDVERQPVRLSNFAPSFDPQVDTREFWRTLGNGEVYFFLDSQPIAETEYVDMVADFTGLHSGPDTQILGDEVLPTDNVLPLPEYGVPVVHANRMWWATSRRAYYSPPGRYESVVGFIDVTPADDGIVFPIRWDDQLFLLTENSVYVVLGQEEPFLSRKLPGVPGCITTAAFPVAAAVPAGIVYLTLDGPRLLRGTSSQLLDPEGLAPIFQEHRTLEGLSGLQPPQAIVGARDRIYLCYPSLAQTLIYDFANAGWRDLGLGTQSGFYDARLDALYLGTATLGTLRFGDETRVADAAPTNPTPIPFVWEPAGVAVNADRAAGLTRYLAFTINTGGQIVTPTVIVDDVETDLPPFSTTSLRVVEYPINRWGRVVSARLTAALTTARLELAECAFDVYLPQTHGVIAPAVEVPAGEGATAQPQADPGDAGGEG